MQRLELEEYTPYPKNVRLDMAQREALKGAYRLKPSSRVKPSKNLTLAGFVASLQNLTEVVSHLSFHVLLLAL